MDSLIRPGNTISDKNVCVKFMFSYQQHDLEAMLQLCDPEGEVSFVPLGLEGKGKIRELGKALWSQLIECFPDIDNTVDAVVSEENNVRCQVLISGTQLKDFAGIKNKGKHFDSDHIFIFRINENGLISDINVSWDHDDLVKQLS